MRTRVFFRAGIRSNSSVRINRSARINKSIFRPLRKLCSIHMTEFEIVVHRNVGNWI